MQIRSRIAAALIAATVALPCAAQVETSAIADFNTCAKPVYPRESLRREQQGTVTLAFLIGLNGDVKQSKVIKSSGFALLDSAAQQGIEKCRFKPAHKDSQPTEAWVPIQYVWSLREKKDDRAAPARDVLASAERGEADGQYQLGMYYGAPKNPDRNPALGSAWLRKAAEQGHPEALYTLGLTHTGLNGGTKNLEEAHAWFRKAADKGHAGAQYAIGMMHLRGQGMARDEAEAVQWLRKAAANGSARAMTGLATLLLRGEESPDNAAQALALLAQAEKLRDGTALYMLGNLHAKGRAVARDMTRAADYYKEAAAIGNVAAQLALLELDAGGEGVAADPAKAELPRAAAAQQGKPGQ